MIPQIDFAQKLLSPVCDALFAPEEQDVYSPSSLPPCLRSVRSEMCFVSPLDTWRSSGARRFSRQKAINILLLRSKEPVANCISGELNHRELAVKPPQTCQCIECIECFGCVDSVVRVDCVVCIVCTECIIMPRICIG